MDEDRARANGPERQPCAVEGVRAEGRHLTPYLKRVTEWTQCFRGKTKYFVPLRSYTAGAEGVA